MMTLEQKITTHKKVKEVINSYLDWSEKYDLIFSEEVLKFFPNLDYYNPDTTYEADTRAFVCAIDEYMKEQVKNYIKQFCES